MSAFRALCLLFAGSFTTGMGSDIKLSAKVASMPMICAVGFPLTISIGMLAGGRNITSGGNLSITIDAPSVTGIPAFTAGSVFCVTYFGVLMVGRINFSIGNIANGANSLVYAGCFTAGVRRFINDITTADRLTLFPMVGFVGCPNRSGAMCTFCNGLTVFYFYVTITAIGISGIAFLITGRFFLIFQISRAFMIGGVHCTVSCLTNCADGFVNTSSLTTAMGSHIKPCTEVAGVPMACAVGLPLAVSIGMLAGSRNIAAGKNLGAAIGAPGISGVTFFTTSGIFGITHFGVLVIRGINIAVFDSAHCAFGFTDASSLSATMSCYIKLCAEITGMPMICAVGFPLAVSICMITGCRNFTACLNFSVAIGTPNVACIALFAASGIFCTTHFGVLVIGKINRTVLNFAYRTDSFFNTGGFSAGMMCFINDIAATDCLTLFPVIGFIRCPN